MGAVRAADGRNFSLASICKVGHYDVALSGLVTCFIVFFSFYSKTEIAEAVGLWYRAFTPGCFLISGYSNIDIMIS